MEDNPTIISKKSIRNIKTCLTNNCNVTILIKSWSNAICYGYVTELRSNPLGYTYIVQYFTELSNEFRYLRIAWNNNEFYVLDYKFD